MMKNQRQKGIIAMDEVNQTQKGHENSCPFCRKTCPKTIYI